VAGCGQAIPKKEEAARGLAEVKIAGINQVVIKSALRKVHTSEIQRSGGIFLPSL
jgi:hypothetical protein